MVMARASLMYFEMSSKLMASQIWAIVTAK